MITQVRKITIDDLKEIGDALKDVPQRLGFGTTEVTKQEYLNYTEKILRSNTHQTWGFYNDNKLISFMSAFDFPNLPYYGILNFKVLRSVGYYSHVTSGYVALMKAVSESKEEQQRYTFFIARSAQRKYDIRQKLHAEHQQADPEFFKKYLRTVEEVVPAGQLSKFDYFNKALLRDKVFDNDMLIMKWTCRNEYRKNILHGEQEYISSMIDRQITEE